MLVSLFDEMKRRMGKKQRIILSSHHNQYQHHHTKTAAPPVLPPHLLRRTAWAKKAIEDIRASAVGTALAHSMSSGPPVVVPEVDPYRRLSSSSSSSLNPQDRAAALRARMPHGAFYV